MRKILCISRMVGVCKEPALESQVTELREIAGSAVHLEFVYSGNQELIQQLLHGDWDAIWARGVTEELRAQIEQHPATKIVAVNRKIEQVRQGRHGEEFDYFAAVELQGLRRLSANGLASPELV